MRSQVDTGRGFNVEPSKWGGALIMSALGRAASFEYLPGIIQSRLFCMQNPKNAYGLHILRDIHVVGPTDDNIIR